MTPSPYESEMRTLLSVLDASTTPLSYPQLRDRTGLHALAPNTLAHRVRTLIERGHARRSTPGRPEFISTDAGRRHLNFFRTHATGTITPARTLPHSHTAYDGAELRPYTGRAGALRAYTLPSRGISA